MNKISGIDNTNTIDSVARRIIHRKDVASMIMEGTIDEFRGVPMEEIMRCIPGEGNIIYGLENDDPVSNIAFDMVYGVQIPFSDVRVIINVETQARYNPGYPLINRGLFYYGNRVVKQKGTEFIGDHYEDMKKVHSIWIVMNPPEGFANKVFSYPIGNAAVDYTDDEGFEPPQYDLGRITFICIGSPYDEHVPKFLRMLNLLFGKGMTPEMRAEKLRENDIIPDEDLMNEMVEMETLQQQFIDMWYDIGIRDGRIQLMLELVSSWMQEGLTFEEAMDRIKIPNNERESLRKEYEKQHRK